MSAKRMRSLLIFNFENCLKHFDVTNVALISRKGLFNSGVNSNVCSGAGGCGHGDADGGGGGNCVGGEGGGADDACMHKAYMKALLACSTHACMLFTIEQLST